MSKVLQILGCGVLSFCLLSMPLFAAEIAVWGSTTCQKRFLEPGNAAFKTATGDEIKVYGVGTGKGMLALIDGKTMAAAASSDLASAIKSAHKEAKKAGKDLTLPANLMFHEIAKDIIVPIVNASNPVNALSFDQLAGLNTGAISNWKEDDGPDLPVAVVTSHECSATREVFQSQVMKKAEYPTNATFVKSTRLEILQVAKNPGAIGAVSEGFYKQNPAGVKTIQTEDISRPLALITIGQPTAEVQKVIDFFRSAEGKKFFE